MRQWRPSLASRLQKPATKLSAVLNFVAFGFIFVVRFHTLEDIRPALTTGVRNVAVSLVIATGSFPGTSAVIAALGYAVFQTIVMALVAVGWGRLAPAKSIVAERAKALGNEL